MICLLFVYTRAEVLISKLLYWSENSIKGKLATCIQFFICTSIHMCNVNTCLLIHRQSNFQQWWGE